MASWREELVDVVKTKAERDAEEAERQRKRVAEALTSAEKAMKDATDALRFTFDRLQEKGQPADLKGEGDAVKLTIHGQSLAIELVRDAAALKVTLGEGKPREFDFAKDRHIAPADVEEYIGRRSLELVRAAQKAHPW